MRERERGGECILFFLLFLKGNIYIWSGRMMSSRDVDLLRAKGGCLFQVKPLLYLCVFCFITKRNDPISS